MFANISDYGFTVIKTHAARKDLGSIARMNPTQGFGRRPVIVSTASPLPRQTRL